MAAVDVHVEAFRPTDGRADVVCEGGKQHGEHHESASSTPNATMKASCSRNIRMMRMTTRTTGMIRLRSRIEVSLVAMAMAVVPPTTEDDVKLQQQSVSEG